MCLLGLSIMHKALAADREDRYEAAADLQEVQKISCSRSTGVGEQELRRADAGTFQKITRKRAESAFAVRLHRREDCNGDSQEDSIGRKRFNQSKPQTRVATALPIPKMDDSTTPGRLFLTNSTARYLSL